MTDRDRDVFILAVTGCCEASDQGDDGLLGVMHSINNRFHAKKWYSGATLAATCVVPYAFSSWNTEDKNRGRVLSMGAANPVFFKCLQIAVDVIDGNIADTTDGATHYYSTKIMAAPPTWVTGKPGVPAAIFTKEIRDHRFYKGVM